VAATEMLKFVMPPSSLQSMNSRMSGWSTRRIPMLAPRRVPPCFTASVAPLKTRRNETGPEARPPVDATMSSLGRRREDPTPAARLVDDRGGLDRVEDLLHRVPDRQDVASRVL